MGSPVDELGRWPDEVQHQVTLTQPFYIGVFEVTQRQWERVMGTWPSYVNNPAYRDSRPVEKVSFHDIRGPDYGTLWPRTNRVDKDTFIERLRARTGRDFDLPTESQWEYAGRAGTTTALNSGRNVTATNRCPNISAVGRYAGNGGTRHEQSVDTTGATAKVGSYPPNAWGLCDMHGNVWEWCLDQYGPYPGTVSDPKGAPEGYYRVVRGGGWGYNARCCRIAGRYKDAPSCIEIGYGLRVALPLGGETVSTRKEERP
jgi:formylglycine-generating enzyme required for sulfatase activity